MWKKKFRIGLIVVWTTRVRVCVHVFDDSLHLWFWHSIALEQMTPSRKKHSEKHCSMNRIMSHQARLPTAVREYEPAPPSFALKDWKILWWNQGFDWLILATTLSVIGWFKLQLWMWLAHWIVPITNGPIITWLVNSWKIEVFPTNRNRGNCDFFLG